MTSAALNEAAKYGAIRNALGLLTDDHKSLIPSKFLEVTKLGPAEAERATGGQRTAFYRSTIPLKPSNKLTKKVTELVVMTDLAYELMGNSIEETAKWLMAPNSLLFGRSPFQVCMEGNATLLIEWLIDRLGKESPLMKQQGAAGGKGS
ncbi:MAG: hypothetical protein HC902_07150 [Calothrix sp. SM1_5_4]|nr:hypothetical protein [Calothrix sp. SM1_5_4]